MEYQFRMCALETLEDAGVPDPLESRELQILRRRMRDSIPSRLDRDAAYRAAAHQGAAAMCTSLGLKIDVADSVTLEHLMGACGGSLLGGASLSQMAEDAIYNVMQEALDGQS
jgi:hypothetical protein